MCRLLVIESKITNIFPCRKDLHTLAESAISDEKDGDKEEQEKKPQQGNYHLRIRFKTKSRYIIMQHALLKTLDC